MSSKVVQKLYKTLLKLSKNFDQNPGSKVLVYRKSLNPSTQKDFILTSQYYSKILNQILRPDKFIYYPNNDTLSFTQLTRKEFREKMDDMLISDRTCVAFAIIRNFSTVWERYRGISLSNVSKVSLEETINNNDHNKDNSNSNSSSSSSSTNDVVSLSMTKENMKATLQNVLTPGTILLSHPMIEGSLRRAVILIIQHSTKGSYGLVLNRQMPYELKDSVAGLSKKMLKLFSTQNVSFGGNVRRLQYIHTIDNVGGVEIPYCSIDSNLKFYTGGDVEKVMEIIEKQHDFKSMQSFIRQNIMFFVGCCTWDVNQLQKEYDAGFWIPVISNTDKVLQESFRLQQYDDNDDDDLMNNHNEDDDSVLHNDFDSKNIANNHNNVVSNDESPEEFTTSMKSAHLTMMSDIAVSVSVLTAEEEKRRLDRKVQRREIYDKELKGFLADHNVETKDGILVDIERDVKYDDDTTASIITIKGIDNNNDLNDDDDDDSGEENVDDDDFDYDDDDDDLSNTAWEQLMSSLGDDYKPLARFPVWIDTSKVTSVDWP